jgi:uncharacterized MAPEG superfamily protein
VNDVHYVLASAGLTWLMIMTSASLRLKEWTPAGVKLGFGNRENVPEPTPVAARADRAAKNMLENMVLFVAVFAAARAAGKSEVTGAAIFFFARLGYWLVYLAGIPYVRTLLWLVALGGVAMIALAATGAR